MARAKSTATKITPRIDNFKLKSLGILSYDFDNLYPHRVDDIVADSGTATSILRLYAKYVGGRGANDIDFGNIKINSDRLTVNKLIRKIAKTKGKRDGVAIHFNYNGLIQKTSISFVPFEYCRLTLDEGKFPDMIAVYDDWDLRKEKKLIKEKISYIHKYDPTKVMDQVLSIEVEEKGKTEEEILLEKWSQYKGQIWYWTPEGDDTYPLAPFDAVLEDMQTEAQTKRFKHGTSARNFLASHLVVTGKQEDDEDENGNPVDKEGGTVADTFEQFQGGNNAGAMVLIEREHEDEQIELKKIEIQNYDGLYEYTENSARDSIMRPSLAPPVLLLQTAGKLGTSTEIADAKMYYNEVTQYDRDEIEELLTEVFDGFYMQVNKTGDYSVMPLEVRKPITKDYFPYYTINEVRVANGDDPVIGGDIVPLISPTNPLVQ